MVAVFLLIYYTDVAGISTATAGPPLFCRPTLLFLTGMFSVSAMAVFYARDVLGNADYYIVMTAMQTVAMVAVAALAPASVPGSPDQTDAAIALIKVAAGIVLAVAVAAVTAVMLAYPLTEKAFRAVVAELAVRRATRAVFAPEVGRT